MISAIASTIFIGLFPLGVGSGTRRKAQGLPPELLRDEVPAERRVVRGAVRVAMTARVRLAVEDGPRAAPLEEPVDGPHAEPRHEGLVAAVAQAVELGEWFTARGPVEDFPDVAPVQGAGGVDLGGGLGQPELDGHGFRGPPRTGGALGSGRELVDGARTGSHT